MIQLIPPRRSSPKTQPCPRRRVPGRQGIQPAAVRAVTGANGGATAKRDAARDVPAGGKLGANGKSGCPFAQARRAGRKGGTMTLGRHQDGPGINP
jgi:hypothetical protein